MREAPEEISVEEATDAAMRNVPTSGTWTGLEGPTMADQVNVTIVPASMDWTRAIGENYQCDYGKIGKTELGLGLGEPS
ncbi:hypothetical protein RRF57_000674 [Xylaria bambusicola]|uniref:Uncharacterized protein n=1 Tax=Xylaria bambusicola TaxID=326684 RepID=A0AAN7UAJ5_9PEZI